MSASVAKARAAKYAQPAISRHQNPINISATWEILKHWCHGYTELHKEHSTSEWSNLPLYFKQQYIICIITIVNRKSSKGVVLSLWISSKHYIIKGTYYSQTLLLHSHVNLQKAQVLLNTKVYCHSHLLLCGQDQLGPQYHECHLHHLFEEMHEISVFGHSWENTNLMKASCGWTQKCHDFREDKNRSCEVKHSHLSRTFTLTQRMPNHWCAQWS